MREERFYPAKVPAGKSHMKNGFSQYDGFQEGELTETDFRQ